MTDIKQDKLEKSAKRIKFYMNDQGLTIQHLANLCNCTRVTISRVINGKYPLSDRLAHDMGRIFSVSPDYLQGIVDDPESGSFGGLEEWYDKNAQNLCIKNVIRYLESINYTITEIIILGDLKFKRTSMNQFIVRTTQDVLIKYGFQPKESDNTDFPESQDAQYITYYCNESDLIKIIQSFNSPQIEHFWEIEYNDNIERVNEAQFINMMYSFSLLTRNYFRAALPNLTEVNGNLSDIEKIIRQHKEERIVNFERLAIADNE